MNEIKNFTPYVKKQVESGKFDRVYYVYGKEPYMKFYNIDCIRKGFLGSDSFEEETYTYDGALLTADEFEAAVNAYTMFSEKKVILIKDLPLNGETAEYFINNCENLSEDNIIIFYDTNESYDKKSDQAKLFIETVQKVGCLADVGYESTDRLLSFVAKQCGKAGLKVTKPAAEHLINCIGPSMYALQNEILKLRSYTKDGELKISDIDELCSNNAEVQGYLVANAIMNGDMAQAFSVTDAYMKTKDSNEIILASTVSTYICKMWKTKILLEKGKDKSDIEEALNVKSSYAYEKFARSHSLEQIEQMLKICADADVSMKTSVSSDTELFRMIASLAQIV